MSPIIRIEIFKSIIAGKGIILLSYLIFHLITIYRIYSAVHSRQLHILNF
jgi:hypothetical protein